MYSVEILTTNLAQIHCLWISAQVKEYYEPYRTQTITNKHSL